MFDCRLACSPHMRRRSSTRAMGRPKSSASAVNKRRSRLVNGCAVPSEPGIGAGPPNTPRAVATSLIAELRRTTASMRRSNSSLAIGRRKKSAMPTCISARTQACVPLDAATATATRYAASGCKRRSRPRVSPFRESRASKTTIVFSSSSTDCRTAAGIGSSRTENDEDSVRASQGFAAAGPPRTIIGRATSGLRTSICPHEGAKESATSPMATVLGVFATTDLVAMDTPWRAVATSTNTCRGKTIHRGD